MKYKKVNPNTPTMWDKKLFDEYEILIGSPIYQDKIQKILNFLKNKEGNLLDIGFGRGYLERKITDKKYKLNIFGIDFSPKTVEYATKNINGKFLVGNIFKIPFKKNQFDYVAVLDVLEHIEKEKILIALKEVRRVTKTNGHLIITVPLNENIKLLNKLNKNYNAHLRDYDIKTLSNELSKTGFKIYKHEYLTAFRYFYLVKKLILKVFPRLRKPNLLIVYANKI